MRKGAFVTDKTMEGLNAALDAARGALARRKKLQSMRADLAGQREERRGVERETAQVLRRERADVEKLEKLSLASLLCALKGDKEEALARERREELTAQLKHDQAVRDLEDIERRIRDLDGALAALAGAEAEYGRALGEKEAFLRAQGGAAGARLSALEEEQAALEARRREIREARQAGQSLLSAVGQMEDSLSEAEDLGTWDIWGGGMLTTMAKHERLDQARWAADQVQRLLRSFRTELADVSLDMEGPSVEIGEFATFADYFFDGLFADLAVQDQIHASQDSVYRTRAGVERVMAKLEAQEREAAARAQALEGERRALVEAT